MPHLFITKLPINVLVLKGIVWGYKTSLIITGSGSTSDKVATLKSEGPAGPNSYKINLNFINLQIDLWLQKYY